MDTKERLKSGDVAKIAAGPGRTAAQSGSRFNRWAENDIIPRDETVWGPGGPAYVYPQWTGAAFAIMSELFDAGIAVSKKELRDLWDYLAEPHAEGCHPHITHILDAVAKGEVAWIIFTLWRHAETGAFVKTCCTRFEEQADKPISSPTPDHEPVGEYIVQLHKLLDRYAVAESNVQPIRGEGV